MNCDIFANPIRDHCIVAGGEGVYNIINYFN